MNPLKISLATGVFGLAFAASAAEPAAPAVILLDHAKVEAAFVSGTGLIQDPAFKVMAGRRVAPGEVEIHERDTDIFYILEGTATFVTGGTASGTHPTTPGEIRATEITGGTPRQLVKGDVIVIPSGVPHQFTKVGGTFLYYVVKVTR